MKLVFFAHPSFLGSQSMGRFSTFLSQGMHQRGHDVQIWSPKAQFFRLPLPKFLKKWTGYIDQYIVFQFEVWWQLRKTTSDALFIFTDQALGPWVPWIKGRPHVIHCHDFLAQRSALGQIKENPTQWFGRQYQAYIRRGYLQGKNFISVSKRTQTDLHEFLLEPPLFSTVIYNGLNQSFSPGNVTQARDFLALKVNIELSQGYVLHVGGNQWYKNRVGIIEIYNAFRLASKTNLPLLLIGQKPNPDLLQAYENSAFKTDIHLLIGIEDELIKAAYIGASVFVFPSLAEGFGWPIAEAMASGCPVVTTDEAPMSEVSGNAGFLIARKPYEKEAAKLWAQQSATMIQNVIDLSPEERKEKILAGIENSKRFDADKALDEIEQVYKNIIGFKIIT